MAQKKPIPLNISFFNEATAIPFTQLITTPIHPGLQVGTEFMYKQKDHSRLFQTCNLSYFYHNHLNQAIGIYTQIGYEYRIRSGFAFSGLFGVGYMHSFTTSEEFTFTGGHYESKTDKGNARFYPSLSFDAGYYVKREAKLSPKIFIGYQSWVEYPFSPGFIPAMTHISFYTGIKFFLANNRSRK